MPSQRDSFISPAGIVPVTRAYIMGNIAGPRRKQPPPAFLFPYQSILPSLPHLLSPLLRSFSHSRPHFLHPLPSPVHSASPPVCDISFWAHSPGHIYYRQPRHNPEAEPPATQRRGARTDTLRRTRGGVCVCILRSVYSLCCALCVDNFNGRGSL